MEKKNYISPICVEKIVMPERGFSLSNPIIDKGFNDYKEEDYQWK